MREITMRYRENRESRKTQKIVASLNRNIQGIEDVTGGKHPSKLFHLWGRQIGKLMGEAWRPTRMSIRIRRIIHPLFTLLGKRILINPQVIENRIHLKSQVMVKLDKEIILSNEPVIFCVNHRFTDDALGSVCAVPRHAYILFGSLPMFFNTVDGISAWLNGVILCNRKVAASRRTAAENAVRLLQMGGNLFIFPEGVWNKTPSRLMLDYWPGVYRIAKATGAKVVPVVHYIRNTDDPSPENVLYTVVDEPLRLDDLSEKDALSLLRDTMATWYYLMMERYGQTTRQELLEGFSSSDEAWESYLAMHTGKIPYYDKEIETTADYRPKSTVLAQNVYGPIADIQTITPENARAVADAIRIVGQACRLDFQRRF